jgi:hypothetical protein
VADAAGTPAIRTVAQPTIGAMPDGARHRGRARESAGRDVAWLEVFPANLQEQHYR